jgi:hypothetical protein
MAALAIPFTVATLLEKGSAYDNAIIKSALVLIAR